jgi:ribosomal protein L13
MPHTKILTPKTFMAKPGQIAPMWVLVDATDRVVGRLARDIALGANKRDRSNYRRRTRISS